MHLSLFLFLSAALLLNPSDTSVISPLEASVICLFDGIVGFPVTCPNAANACAYSGITCASQNGASWNATIIGLTLSLSFFSGSKQQFMPTELGNLRSLQTLIIYRFPITYQTTLPSELGNCQLTTLQLDGVGLNGTLPVELFRNSNLTHLDLSLNALSGTLPTQIATLSQLRTLTLFGNNFNGTLPPSLATLTTLSVLNLGTNAFSGLLPPASALSSLSQYIMSNNQFTGSLPVFNASTLTMVDVSDNRLNGPLGDSMLLAYSSSALFIDMKNNQLTGTLPASLFVPSLCGLDLSYNQLTGTIPQAVLQSASTLEQLVLSHNQLTGSLPSAWHDQLFLALFRMSLDHNQLNGSLPRFVLRSGATQVLNATFSAFQGFIHLDLSDNAFSGVVPVWQSFSVSTSVDLSNNQLSLDMGSFGMGVNMTWLNMANNSVGNLSSDLFGDNNRFGALRSLDLSYCRISGTLPSMFRLQFLKLQNNLFTGVVPQNFIFIDNQEFLPVFVDLALNRLQSESSRNSLFGVMLNYAYDGSEVLLNDFPQDVDECGLNTSQCAQLCVDGWFPVPGYTCACLPGFSLNVNDKRQCDVVCGDGLLRYPSEQCDYIVSPYACHFNCTIKPGYRCDTTGCLPICGDGIVVPPEQCDTRAVGCSPACTVMGGYSCSASNNTCQPCAQPWQPFILPNNLLLFPQFQVALLGLNATASLFNVSRFDYASCLSCSDKGLSLQTRTVLPSDFCTAIDTRRVVQCSFACSNLTVFGTALDTLFTVRQELERGDFLNQILFPLFGLNASITKKRELSQLEFTLSPCTSALSPEVNVSQVAQILQALALDIAPHIPTLTVTPQSTCALLMQSQDPVTPSPFLSALIGIVAAVIAALMLLIIVLIFYRQSELHSLPEEISWSFIDKLTHPWRWEYHGSSDSGYFARKYSRESEEYQRVSSLLVSWFNGKYIQVDEIVAVYNRSLSVSFVNRWKLLTTRKRENEGQFFATPYRKNVEKMRVMEYFRQNILSITGYNTKLEIPLIPVVHGTNFAVAEKIAQTGFASLSSLDSGYYGKGIYFTTQLCYTLSYACMHRIPAVIISYINMGNIYPVTEDHRKPQSSLKGKAIQAGYNSHLVLTNKKGNLYQFGKEPDLVCDGICNVPFSESQILPAFIVKLNMDSCRAEFDKWDRDLPEISHDSGLQSKSVLNKEYYGDGEEHTGSSQNSQHVQLTILSTKTDQFANPVYIDIHDSL